MKLLNAHASETGTLLTDTRCDVCVERARGLCVLSDDNAALNSRHL
jgi:hypothetical protein